MKYIADQLHTDFSQLGYARKGNPAYNNDSTYWDGGHCNWGGSHNLREDCGTLARGFDKLQSLDSKKIIEELNKCTSQQEYETKKRDYTRKVDEISNNLHPRTGASSAMFGICIIWADDAMSPYVEEKMQECRRELDELKSQLTGEKYQHIEELRRLKLEQKQIEKRIQENKRKASKEKDPTKRAALLLLIEEDGKKLEDNLRKQQAIPTSKINFDPSKYVSDMIEGIKKALEKKARGNSGGDGNSGSGGGGNRRNPTDPNDPFDSDSDNNNDPDGNNNKTPRNKRKKDDDNQSNQQLIIFAVVALVVLFLLMNQKDSQPRSRYEYDY
ncbi:hypothetical protein [endosymbiont GvMRE of Glomus versiforme]|uniref:hypothetical protein n=1 Tax=endosymbiont GvMRE of Glomus versiforme TaxID=2039283 RepID=UPI000ED895A8|nr:hypothetical protein [endosymbiont GvMRE of Glomus versiforme]RHZ36570.1 hypothetical protein GvMRE_I2g233 [endosymbiont GvMRE of Glomus versiforme]